MLIEGRQPLLDNINNGNEQEEIAAIPAPQGPIFFKHCLPIKWSDFRLPSIIRIYRNIAITLLFFQIVVSLIGLGLVMARKAKIYFVFHGSGLVLAFIGLIGALYIKHAFLIIHAFITSTFLGAFFLYQIVEAIMLPSHRIGGEYRWSERTIILVLSIPYFVDFCIAIFVFAFIDKISAEEKLRENLYLEPEYEIEPRPNPGNLNVDPNSRKCVICMIREKDAIIYNCGHRACCFECLQIIQRRHNARCPVCRNHINDVIKIYE